MRIRDVVLQNRISVIDARVWTFNIDLVDPVTEFKVDIRVTTHGDVGKGDECIPYCVREIAIIDGSEVIASMNGAECFAMSCFNQGYPPMHWHDESAGRENHWCMPIQFGRSLTDPEWIFDPRKFRNPQIRIDWDLALCGGVGACHWLTGSVEVTVWAKVMEEGARPRGYLMTKEIRSYTSGNSGDEITWLPVDFPHRKLMIRCYRDYGDMNAPSERIKLSQDQDKWIPFDLYGNDFQYLMRDWFTEFDFHLKHNARDGERREHFQGSGGGGVGVPGSPGVILQLSDWATNTVIFGLTSDTGTTMGAQEIWTYGKTRNPFDCYCYPFGDQDNAADWLQTAQMGNLRLILTQNYSALEDDYQVEIVCQQAHPY